MFANMFVNMFVNRSARFVSELALRTRSEPERVNMLTTLWRFDIKDVLGEDNLFTFARAKIDLL